jgi:hypothetical protein
MDDIFKLSTGVAMSTQFNIASTSQLANDKVLILNVDNAANAFVPGADSIEINPSPSNYFYDLAYNRSLASQAVKILPQ